MTTEWRDVGVSDKVATKHTQPNEIFCICMFLTQSPFLPNKCTGYLAFEYLY